MIRAKTICTMGSCGKTNYEYKEPTWQESVTDPSYWMPVKEMVKSAKPSQIDKTMYDFPDGKDTGINKGMVRSRKDIAEISKEIRAEQNRMRSEVEKTHKHYVEEKEYEKLKKKYFKK